MPVMQGYLSMRPRGSGISSGSYSIRARCATDGYVPLSAHACVCGNRSLTCAVEHL